MAVGTTMAIIAAGVSIASGAAKTITAAKQRKKYQQMIDGYQRQELKNPYENLRVSTLGAMVEQENTAQNTATALYNLRQSGTNAVIGATGLVVKQSNQVNKKIAAELDKQAARNELYKAQGSMQIQGMAEQREQEDLAGLGTALNASNQNMWGGMADVTRAGMSFASGIADSGAFSKIQPKVKVDPKVEIDPKVELEKNQSDYYNGGWERIFE